MRPVGGTETFYWSPVHSTEHFLQDDDFAHFKVIHTVNVVYFERLDHESMKTNKKL